MPDSTERPAQADAAPDVKPGYRRWLLALLTASIALNMLDRKIINILAEPIKHDLGLSDAQLGALTGLAFALLYCTAALPLARIADRGDRVRVLGVSVLVWSAFTALGGAATSFLHLFLLRIGVGVGEAGCAPPAQSLIVDHFPPENRSSALAVFMSGSSIGAAAGLVAGGLLAGWIGWRWTIVCAGVPGLLIGTLVLATLRDPRRRIGQAAPAPLAPVLTVLSKLIRNPSFVMIALAFGLVGFTSITTMAFAGSFYLRVHGAGLAELAARLGLAPIAVVGLGLGLFGAVGGAAGSLTGGLLADRLAPRHPRALVLIPAAGALLSTFGYVAMFTVPSVSLSLVLSAVAVFFLNFYGGPGFNALQRLVDSRSRATAIAVTMFIASGIGLGLGPVTVGALSDALSVQRGAGEGLRTAILVGIAAVPIAALLFALASRTLERDIAKAG